MSLSDEVVGQGFCIFLNTFCQGATIAVRDGENWPVVFATEREAQLEIVDYVQTRLQEFLDGERNFDDATTVEEYVMPVLVLRSGAVMAEDRQIFGNVV